MNIVRDNRCRGVCVVATGGKTGISIVRTARAHVVTFPTTRMGGRHGIDDRPGWTKPRRFGHMMIDAPHPDQVAAVLQWIAAHGRPELEAAEAEHFATIQADPVPGFDRRPEPPAISRQQVVMAAARAVGAPPEDVYGDSRNVEAVEARELAAAALRGWFGDSYPRIARTLRRRGHSVVHRAVSVRWIARSEESRKTLVESLVRELGHGPGAQPASRNSAAPAAEGNRP